MENTARMIRIIDDKLRKWSRRWSDPGKDDDLFTAWERINDLLDQRIRWMKVRDSE